MPHDPLKGVEAQKRIPDRLSPTAGPSTAVSGHGTATKNTRELAGHNVLSGWATRTRGPNGTERLTLPHLVVITTPIRCRANKLIGELLDVVSSRYRP